MSDLEESIFEELSRHHRTRGVAVAQGVTCECGFWEKGRKQAAGADGLDRHRAEVLVELLTGKKPSQPTVVQIEGQTEIQVPGGRG